MEKQAECAAAMSSSGLVLPLASSLRAFHVTSNVPSPDESRVVWPEPSVRVPFQTVWAVRMVAMLRSFIGAYGTERVDWLSHPRHKPTLPARGLSADWVERGRCRSGPDGRDPDVKQGKAADCVGEARRDRLAGLPAAVADEREGTDDDCDDELERELDVCVR